MNQASKNPTLQQLAESLSTIDDRTAAVLYSLEEMHAASSQEFTKVWTALGGIAGLDGLSVGLAQIAEIMGPMRALAPPRTAEDLGDGVPEALAAVRDALGGARDSNYQQLPTDWERPARFIGEAVPVARRAASPPRPETDPFDHDHGYPEGHGR